VTGEFITRNLIHRPLRTIITVLAVAVEVALVVIIVGLTTGLMTETAKRIEGIGADVMVQAPSSSVFLAFSGSPMPIKIGDKLKELKYVEAVAPVFVQFNTEGVEIIYGIDKESFHAVSGGFVFLEGHDIEGPDDLLMDDWAAKAKHVKVGQTFRMLDHDWRLTGIVEHGKGARLFVPMLTLQELIGAREKASLFFVKCTRPEHTPDVTEEIRQLLPRYEIRPLKDYLSLMSSTNLPGLKQFVDAMIALAVGIGFLVIFLSMYTTVIERTRDIGVLKSIGAGKDFIVKALLAETTAVCVLGILAGIGLSYASRAVLLLKFPTLSILITPGWILKAAVIAIVGGLIGASYPAWMASRKDPIEALAYE
jgi:putative ABC transport system permease protein